MRSGSPTTPSTSQRRLRPVILPPWSPLPCPHVSRGACFLMGVTFEVAGRYPARVRSIPGGADLRRRFVTVNDVAPLLAICPLAAPPKRTQYSAPPLTRRSALAPVRGF